MQLHLLSDIHLDDNEQLCNQSLIPIFIQYCRSLKSDLIIINGDMTKDLSTVSTIQKTLERYGVRIIVIPGNNELFQDPTRPLYQQVEHFKKHSLYLKNRIDRLHHLTEDWSLLPGLGFFDGTFVTPFSNEELFEYFKDDTLISSELEGLDHSSQFITEQISIWQNELNKYPTKKIILAQHFAPYDEIGTYNKEGDHYFQYRVKILGSTKLSDFIQANPQIKIVHYGHTHLLHQYNQRWGRDVFCFPVGRLTQSNKSFIETLQMNTVEISI